MTMSYGKFRDIGGRHEDEVEADDDAFVGI